MHSVFLVSWFIGIPLAIGVVLVIGVAAEKVGLHLPFVVTFPIAFVIFFAVNWLLMRIAAAGYEAPVPGKPDPAKRHRAASAANALLEGKITWAELSKDFNDSKDPEIDALYDLLEHQPTTTGPGSVSESFWKDYRRQIDSLISKLETKADEKSH